MLKAGNNISNLIYFAEANQLIGKISRTEKGQILRVCVNLFLYLIVIQSCILSLIEILFIFYCSITLYQVRIPDSLISILNKTELLVKGAQITFKINDLWSYAFNSWYACYYADIMNSFKDF